MKSIAGSMDEYDIAQEIRIERQIHKGSFLLLEGVKDIRRFSKFTDPGGCSTVNCYGRENLVGAIELLYEDGFLGCLGLADADFDRVLEQLKGHEGLIYSDTHDFDLDSACEEALTRYLAEVGDQKKCGEAGGTMEIAKSLMVDLKPLSALRFLNVKRNLGYSLTDVNHVQVCKNGRVNLGQLIEHVSTGQFANEARKTQLRNLITPMLAVEVDYAQFTNGHDFFALLGICLRDRLGGRLPPQSWGDEVEMHFRLAFSDDDFSRTGTFKAIRLWENENAPFVIFKNTLRRLH